MLWYIYFTLLSSNINHINVTWSWVDKIRVIDKAHYACAIELYDWDCDLTGFKFYYARYIVVALFCFCPLLFLNANHPHTCDLIMSCQNKGYRVIGKAHCISNLTHYTTLRRSHTTLIICFILFIMLDIMLSSKGQET